MSVFAPWIKVSQPGLQNLMTLTEWMQTPEVMRLWIAAQSRMYANGHAVFDRDELLILLGRGGSIDAHGQIEPIIPMHGRSLARLAKRLMDGGYLVELKSSRGSLAIPSKVCVVVSSNLAEMGRSVTGANKECPVHHTYASAFAA
jgi:hypothetical protein